MRTADLRPDIEALATVRQPKRPECRECVTDRRDVGRILRTVRSASGAHLLRQLAEPHAIEERAPATGASSHCVGQPGERWLYCYPDDKFAAY